MGVAPDLGTLQRLPKIVGNDSWVREIIYTARKFTSNEAKERGLVRSVKHLCKMSRPQFFSFTFQCL